MSELKVNSDLVKERQKCSFDPSELTHFLDGGKARTEARRIKEIFFLDGQELQDTVPTEYLSHKEKYERAVRRGAVVWKKVRQVLPGEFKVEDLRDFLDCPADSVFCNDGNPFSLHYTMFLDIMLNQAAPEQLAEWVPKIRSLDILGTYAQTELGHGTFIRGLETTATYDSTTEEFVLDSPTLTSYKWWPGNLGHTSNHAVVMAQLYSEGKCHGIHPFIVPLRDKETHVPLPGIKVGEVGCKLGSNQNNNGFLGFDQVRIPRKNMLMKYAKVLKDGTYVKAPNSKLAYGTMMLIRYVIVLDSAYYLKKAVTIAVRYSAVRRQSAIKEGEPEAQILDFCTQQYKIFPQLSKYFALRNVGIWLSDMYSSVMSEVSTGDISRLLELHAITCCLKAVGSADASTAIEICRLACGGHGYMTSSNFPRLYGLATATATYEGENTVLLLQTARYLLKAWLKFIQGEDLPPLLLCFKTSLDENPPFEKSVSWISFALGKAAASKIDLAAAHFNDRIQNGIQLGHAWNQTSIELVNAAEAYCRAFIVSTNSSIVKNAVKSMSEPLGKALLDLCELYAVDTALKFSDCLLRYCHISGAELEELQIWLEELLTSIRPNAVGIVDGFDIRDELLDSTLGAYDGNVYQRIFAEAAKSPLNAEPVNKSFQLYLKPLLESKL